MGLKKTKITDYCSRTELTIGIVSIIILATLFFYLCGSSIGLKTNPGYAKGVIIDSDSRGWNNRTFIRYTFIVEGKPYEGSTRYRPHLQTINIGDTCYVIYEKNYPANCKLVQIEGRYYKIKKPE